MMRNRATGNNRSIKEHFFYFRKNFRKTFKSIFGGIDLHANRYIIYRSNDHHKNDHPPQIGYIPGVHSNSARFFQKIFL